MSHGLADYVLPSLRPSKKTGSQLEGFHNRFVCRILGVDKLAEEDLATFVRRRNSLVSSFKRENKIDIRARWALKLVTWVEHVFRHRERPAFSLLACQNDDWLRTQRALAGNMSGNRGLDAGATSTRSGRGAPIRWGSHWIEFIQQLHGWGNLSRDKQQSCLRASSLDAQFIRERFLFSL